MKELQQQDVQLYYRHAWTLTAVAAAVITALRVLLTPFAAQQPLAYAIALALAGVVLVVVLVLCALKPSKTIVVGGKHALAAAIGAAVSGATLIVFSLSVASNWFTEKVLPFPSKSTVAAVDQIILYLLILSGLLGGAYYLYLAATWWLGRRTTRGEGAIFALLPVVWSWMRLVRYITSYVSSIGLFRNVYELGTMLFEMVFFLLVARYLMEKPKTPSRFFMSVSLCAGLLCTISFLSQIGFFFLQDQESFSTCALVVVPDLGVAVFAFIMAFVQAYAVPQEEPEEVAQATPIVYETDDDEGEGAEFLISAAWFHESDAAENESNENGE